MSTQQPTIIYTLTDEAPRLATSAFLPVVRTFIVTSTADTSDATPGDGACADSQNRCTLRAAMKDSPR